MIAFGSIEFNKCKIYLFKIVTCNVSSDILNIAKRCREPLREETTCRSNIETLSITLMHDHGINLFNFKPCIIYMIVNFRESSTIESSVQSNSPKLGSKSCCAGCYTNTETP